MYTAQDNRYEGSRYRRCGNSGIKLPEISLGLWHNFGSGDEFNVSRQMLLGAFDIGITHFDLANNYGPPYGSAENTFGKILNQDLRPYRDELIISTKAGWDMWPGPYGDFGSRKYLIASLDQSLQRMGLEYVDIFYHHRPDYDTPLEETMGALEQIVKSGKALYVGLSQYDATRTSEAVQILNARGIPLLIHQPRYNMLDRWIEPELLSVLKTSDTGSIVFSPLAQGLLTDKYIGGIPEGSRAAKEGTYLQATAISHAKLAIIQKLNKVAVSRGNTLAQMAVNWTLRDEDITSALIGASSLEQIKEIVAGRTSPALSPEDLNQIDSILSE